MCRLCVRFVVVRSCALLFIVCGVLCCVLWFVVCRMWFDGVVCCLLLFVVVCCFLCDVFVVVGNVRCSLSVVRWYSRFAAARCC